MNAEEKSTIRKLREEGFGYTEIAKKMHVSINTIKSYCKRNGLGGVATSKAEIFLCEFCAQLIKQNKGRKKKRFCSDLCRNAWWNKHTDLVKKHANYECVCLYCGKTFLSYGNSKRKYCSHTCYIKDRFGGAHHASY